MPPQLILEGRVFVTGERTGGGWRDFERWPPSEDARRQLWIEGEDHLAWEPPPAGANGSRCYRYDPADPTPSRGGPVMITSKPVRDNRPLEARADVLTFTTAPLEEVLEAIGPVRVQPVGPRERTLFRSVRPRVRG
jgi:uncharacterized protein